jgi:hypothetical protein
MNAGEMPRSGDIQHARESKHRSLDRLDRMNAEKISLLDDIQHARESKRGRVNALIPKTDTFVVTWSLRGKPW